MICPDPQLLRLTTGANSKPVSEARVPQPSRKLTLPKIDWRVVKFVGSKFMGRVEQLTTAGGGVTQTGALTSLMLTGTLQVLLLPPGSVTRSVTRTVSPTSQQ